jgi:hypothetical protein
MKRALSFSALFVLVACGGPAFDDACPADTIVEGKDCVKVVTAGSGGAAGSGKSAGGAAGMAAGGKGGALGGASSKGGASAWPAHRWRARRVSAGAARRVRRAARRANREAQVAPGKPVPRATEAAGPEARPAQRATQARRVRLRLAAPQAPRPAAVPRAQREALLARWATSSATELNRSRARMASPTRRPEPRARRRRCARPVCARRRRVGLARKHAWARTPMRATPTRRSS